MYEDHSKTTLPITMSSYDSGYDPKYGYNRNAFAHKTVGTALMGRVVKIIVTPIGLVSETIHARKDRRRSSSDAVAKEASSNTSARDDRNPTKAQIERQDSAYVEVPPEVADQLIASGHAEPTDRHMPTHELVVDENNDDIITRDEADWALDEASAETEEQDPSSPDSTTLENPKAQPPAPSRSVSQTLPPIPFPIILPQRRPGTKTRGFVRAYPPILHESRIPQSAFLRFLKDLHTAAQASPIFSVVMIATAIAAAYPDPVVGLGVQAVQVAVGIGQEMQERYRTNKFLTQANRDFFGPKGLYAMIVAYKSGGSEQPDVGVERVDLGAAAVAKYGGDAQTGDGISDSEKPKKLDEIKDKMKQLRIASGSTHGETEMPVTCAPLIFPALDAAAAASPDAKEERSGEGIGSTIKAKSKSASKFVNDYYDRRAQASYVRSHRLAAPSLPTSSSKHSDRALQAADPKPTGLSKPLLHPNRPSSPLSPNIPLALRRPQPRNQHALLHPNHRRQVQSRAVSPPPSSTIPPVTTLHKAHLS